MPVSGDAPAGLVVVVTGTDTGVGKTVTAAGFARALTMLGRRVIAVKPVETGCGEVVSREEDGVLLAAATGQLDPPHALYRFRTPVTPALAAEIENVVIEYDALVQRLKDLSQTADVTVVEGAGGLYAPITWKHNILSVARDLRASVLVVASDRLGTINHTLLTLQALDGLDVVAVVLNAPDVADDSTGSNAQAIFRHGGALGIAANFLVEWMPRVAGVDEAAERLEGLAQGFSDLWIDGWTCGLGQRDSLDD